MKVSKVQAGIYQIINDDGIRICQFQSLGPSFWEGKVYPISEQDVNTGWSSGKKSGIVTNTKKQYVEQFMAKYNEKGEKF